MSRWEEKELKALQQMRISLKKEKAANIIPFPDVIGDRRLIRFLRGKQLNVAEATKQYIDFLKWRTENKVDNIRQEILYGGINSPLLFPFGKRILDLAPQVVISARARDKMGQPMAMEMYNFSPATLFKKVTLKEYMIFLTYALEYRALVMEQLSHEAEQQYLKEHPEIDQRKVGYGVVLLNFTIRDLNGVGMGHVGSDGRSLIKAALDLGIPNYPEYLGKCYMVNVPWVFNSFWHFIKGTLDEKTLSKISLNGSSNVLESLMQDIPKESIPTTLGGSFGSFNEPFEFDLSESGPFYVSAEDVLLVEKVGERSDSGERQKTHSLSIEVVEEDTSRREVDKVLQQVLTAIVIESSLRSKAAAAKAAGEGADNDNGSTAPVDAADGDGKSFQYTDVFICDDWDGGSPSAFGYDSDFSSPLSSTGYSNSLESPFMNNPLLKRKLFFGNTDNMPIASDTAGDGSDSTNTTTNTTNNNARFGKSPSSVELVYQSLRNRRAKPQQHGNGKHNHNNEISGTATTTPPPSSPIIVPSSSASLKRLSGRKQAAVSILEAIEENPNEEKENNVNRAVLLRRRIYSDTAELLCILAVEYPLSTAFVTLIVMLWFCGYPTIAKIVTPLVFIYTLIYGLS